ncbi:MULTISPECIES: hypothetical protein [unclassified Nocardia]|uniref:hypothetical protein n=1 Tax=unclassified Nocardia TaxID=2637762 RepID=UPI001CE41052|nr:MULTISPECIES: hypothetical protein [unclassified Nocardia]
MLSSSCSHGPPSSGPTNKDILDSTGLTVADAEMVMLDNMVAISPQPAFSYATPIDRAGCQANASGARNGPPWRLSAINTFKSVSSQDGEAVLAKVDALAARGYTIRTSDAANPRSRHFKDKRGFEIGASYAPGETGTGDLIVQASTPCAAEKESLEITLRDDEASIRAATRVMLSVNSSGDWDALDTVACNPLSDKIRKLRYGWMTVSPDGTITRDENLVDESLETERKANFAARGYGWMVDISNVQWTDMNGQQDLLTPVEATAEITVRYERHAQGLDSNNTARYRARYSSYREVDAKWHICAWDPV